MEERGARRRESLECRRVRHSRRTEKGRGMTHIITEPCIGVKDTACVDVCPVDCIYGKSDDWEQLYIHPEECIDCGLCIDACPVQAIFPAEEVPEKWKEFIAKNYEKFDLTAP